MKKNRTYHPRKELVDGFRCQAHPVYDVWANMMSRCYDPGSASYVNYGARGIKVDPQWHHFRNFTKDMGIRPDDDSTLERKDNGRWYEKSNCVWATRSDQCVNRRLFKNNTTGRTGVIKTSQGRWEARFEYLGVRYKIGRYSTLDKASFARDEFVRAFREDAKKAVKTKLTLKEEVVWNNAKSGVRGVSPHVGGGYMVRCTIAGVRHYVGYYKTIEEGERARREFIKDKTGAA